MAEDQEITVGEQCGMHAHLHVDFRDDTISPFVVVWDGECPCLCLCSKYPAQKGQGFGGMDAAV